MISRVSNTLRHGSMPDTATSEPSKGTLKISSLFRLVVGVGAGQIGAEADI